MYNLNTKEGKEKRVETLKELIIKVSNRNLDLDDERKIISYLTDVEMDLEAQLFMASIENK